MDTAITINELLKIVAVGVALWGGYKVIKEFVEAINTRHDQRQKWDSYDTEIAGINTKLQELNAEQCMLTYCMMATLDGLHQLGANGKVTEAREKLDKFINKQAHGQSGND